MTRWYGHAGTIITDAEWEALRQVAKEAAKKYPLEDLIRDVRNKVERAYLMRFVKSDDAAE